MADKHPYVTSSGPLIQFINHLRKSFPAQVTSDTLKKLGYAKQNESYVINTLRFIGVIDEEGKKTEKAGKIFSQHEDKAFQKEFSVLVKETYPELFTLHSEEAWTLNLDTLMTFFRQTDYSTALVGKKQANTFRALAALSGHGEIPEPKASTSTVKAEKIKKIDSAKQPIEKRKESLIGNTDQSQGVRNAFGLTVRIEINLPSEGNQKTYDSIFKSIRENLLNG